MKKYEKPAAELVELQIEEDIALDIGGGDTSSPFA